MTRTVRSRRAEAAAQPLYARVLRLRHLAPSGLLCFVFLEGAVVLGILLALAELVSWWGVLVLPITVALMVKLNDLVAGTFAFGPAVTQPATARVAVLRPAAMPPSAPEGAGRPVGGVRSSFNAAGQSPADGVWSAPAYGQGAGSAPVAGSVPVGGHGAAPVGGHGVAPVGGHGVGSAPVGGDHPAAGAGGQMPAGPRAAPVAGYPRATTYGRPHAEGAGSRPAGAGGPARRPWADQLDVRQQVARQAAARRYE